MDHYTDYIVGHEGFKMEVPGREWEQERERERERELVEDVKSLLKPYGIGPDLEKLALAIILVVRQHG